MNLLRLCDTTYANILLHRSVNSGISLRFMYLIYYTLLISNVIEYV